MTSAPATLTAALERLDALAAARAMVLERDAPLGPLTTLRVGGPADRLASVRDADGLLGALRAAREAQVPLFVLGNGSDVVVADAGIRGLVIRNRARGIAIDDTILRVESGTQMAALVKRCTAEGLSGIEFAISVPGTLGGAVWANAGAHGSEMRDLVREVEVYDPSDGTTTRLPADACRFAYRESRFKHRPEIVLAATLALRRGDPAAIAAKVEEHQAYRRATQPLADQNAGSVFRNPAGDHAGRLIDAAGLKGRRVGSAVVSTLHANFIVTDREGRAGDVRELGDLVRRSVAERFEVTLEYEIEFVGDWTDAPDADR